jgi:hypothetical protein
MQAPLKQMRRFSRWKIASTAAAGEGTDDDAILDIKFPTWTAKSVSPGPIRRRCSEARLLR